MLDEQQRGLARWMRQCAIPTDIIGHCLGISPKAASRASSFDDEPFDLAKYLGIEMQLLHSRSAAAERGRRIANGKRALAAFRARREEGL